MSYGSAVYGGQTLSNTVKDFEAQGNNNVIGAINADFFSMSTGIPLGILITDGILRARTAARPPSSALTVPTTRL